MTAPMPPNAGQFALLSGAIGLFVLGGAISVARLWRPTNSLRLAAKSMAYFGICLALGALIWHCWRRGSWLPLEDNFEALVALAIMLAGFTLYVQRARPIPGLDWFLMPIVIVMLLWAGLFGKIKPRATKPDELWNLAHRLSSFTGVAAFGVAAGVGTMYLLASAKLRRKAAISSAPMGSLERLENLTHWALSFGFALLTVGIITGLVKILEKGGNTQLGPHWMTSPKVILAFTGWVVYAIALHTPITPAVRGRKSAMLSIVGFALMIATMLAVLCMPNGR
ncbi:MAG TPA: cytochrome c biogenesis protein CcsA [Tepidisphaeraceae bacterium]|jgi:ABC-type transport system involved in cytochrome c biogenesis permease subunit|nr:cytochrome c biogenesis protein CcsA [Tepidisphaeraceae bacterium]